MPSNCAQTSPLDGCNCIVAVIDNDLAVRDSVRFLLETAGFGVVTYGSASQFLAAADGNPPAFLILDHNMPSMTGLELLAELRKRAYGVPVILMTASPTAELHSRATELGVGLVLAKPLLGDDLIGFVSASATRPRVHPPCRC